MSGGNNHAKLLVVRQAEEMKKTLAEENSEITPKQVSQLFGYLIDMIKPVYLFTFRTEKSCDELRGTCPCLEEVKQKQEESKQEVKKPATLRLGPMTWQGSLSNFGVALLFFIYLIGKGKKWW